MVEIYIGNIPLVIWTDIVDWLEKNGEAGTYYWDEHRLWINEKDWTALTLAIL